MNMIDKIRELKERSRNATSKELAIIDQEMQQLSIENPSEFSEAMLFCVEETNEKVEEFVLKQRLEEILPIISVSYLAKNYFKKTPQWFYQRLNGNSVNGKKASFTTQEIKTLSFALREIGQKLNAVVFVL
jgi:hypothetical protein